MSGTTIITTTTRVCGDTTGLNTIAGANGFVEEGKDVTATYRGDANGAYIAGGETGYFRASVELTAEFQNPITQGNINADDGEGSIQGSVTNIVAGGQSMAGSIELQKQRPLGDDISRPLLMMVRPSAWLTANPSAAHGRASFSE